MAVRHHKRVILTAPPLLIIEAEAVYEAVSKRKIHNES
jgi:hypothetical protein